MSVSKKYNLDEFHDVSRLLDEADVDDEYCRERIHDRMKFKIESASRQNNFTKGEEIYMKKNKRRSAAVAAALLVCLLGGLSVTAYGQEIVHNILARFQAGHIEITQYDKLPEVGTKNSDTEKSKQEGRVNTDQYTSIEAARKEMGVDFEVPAWLPEGFSYTTAVQHGAGAVELQYNNGGDGTLFSLLISQGENGISTDKDVKVENIAGHNVCFANGIILWGQDNLNYEIYYTGEKDFDRGTLEKIIGGMTADAVSYDKAPPANAENRETAGPAQAEREQ
jgi:hypothetical protein